MRKVPRRYTAKTVSRVVHPLRRSTDYPGVESGVDTLMERFKALKDGDSLYPWSNTQLRIANGRREWIAKQDEAR